MAAAATEPAMMGTQLLFFDTFSHEAVEELNLDLVQFPSPVVVEEEGLVELVDLVLAELDAAAGGCGTRHLGWLSSSEEVVTPTCC